MLGREHGEDQCKHLVVHSTASPPHAPPTGRALPNQPSNTLKPTSTSLQATPIAQHTRTSSIATTMPTTANEKRSNHHRLYNRTGGKAGSQYMEQRRLAVPPIMLSISFLALSVAIGGGHGSSAPTSSSARYARLARVQPALTALPRAPPTATSTGHLAPQLGVLHCVLLRRYRPRRRPCAIPGRAALAGEMDEYGCEDVDFGGDGDMILGEMVLIRDSAFLCTYFSFFFSFRHRSMS